MKEKTTQAEPRNQSQSQSDGFADVAGSAGRQQSHGEHSEDSTKDRAIRDRAYQLYEESNREDGNADQHWRQAEHEATLPSKKI